MKVKGFEFVLPDGWLVRQGEQSGVTVLMPPENPSEIQFRPTLVITCSEFEGRTISQLFDETSKKLGQINDTYIEVARSLRTEELEDIESITFSYLEGTINVIADQYIKSKDDFGLIITATYARADSKLVRDELAIIAKSIGFKDEILDLG